MLGAALQPVHIKDRLPERLAAKTAGPRRRLADIGPSVAKGKLPKAVVLPHRQRRYRRTGSFTNAIPMHPAISSATKAAKPACWLDQMAVTAPMRPGLGQGDRNGFANRTAGAGDERGAAIEPPGVKGTRHLSISHDRDIRNMEYRMLKKDFVGTWQLIDYGTRLADGTRIEPLGGDPYGLGTYTVDGWMSAHLMRRDRASLGGA